MIIKGYEYQSEALRQSFAEGEARGEAKGAARIILRRLAGRGLCVSPEIRDRITGCTDIAQLETWSDRANLVTTARQLFDDPETTA